MARIQFQGIFYSVNAKNFEGPVYVKGFTRGRIRDAERGRQYTHFIFFKKASYKWSRGFLGQRWCAIVFKNIM